MPNVHLSPAEARALNARRRRNKVRNAILYEVADRIKKRLNKADPLEAATINGVLGDIKGMLRI